MPEGTAHRDGVTAEHRRGPRLRRPVLSCLGPAGPVMGEREDHAWRWYTGPWVGAASGPGTCGPERSGRSLAASAPACGLQTQTIGRAFTSPSGQRPSRRDVRAWKGASAACATGERGPYASRAAGVKRGLPSRAAMAASRRLGRRFCLVGLAGSFIWPPVERGPAALDSACRPWKTGGLTSLGMAHDTPRTQSQKSCTLGQRGMAWVG